MESIQSRIQIGMLTALKNGDRRRKDVLSYILSEMQTASKANLSSELSDLEAIALLQKQSKRAKETLDAASTGGRADAISQSEYEIGVINEFLPEAPSTERIEEISRAVIREIGASSIRDMGRIMTAVVGRLPGVDKSTLSSAVKRLLSPS